MAKVIFKDKKSLQDAKCKTCGVVGFREMKDGRVVASKWPTKRKSLKKNNQAIKHNHEKIAQAVMRNFKEGKIVSNKEIVDVVQKEFPDVPRGSIMPYDYCVNHKNRDPRSGKYHIFEKDLGNKGRYEVLAHSMIKKSCLKKS